MAPALTPVQVQSAAGVCQARKRWVSWSTAEAPQNAALMAIMRPHCGWLCELVNKPLLSIPPATVARRVVRVSKARLAAQPAASVARRIQTRFGVRGCSESRRFAAESADAEDAASSATHSNFTLTLSVGRVGS